MKHVVCSQCRQSFGMNDMYSVLERQLCRTCAELHLAQHQGQDFPDSAATQQADPTICALCGVDNGNAELPMIGELPFCADCERHIRNRPYPAWLKFSFAALIGLAICSCISNWRFITAYREIQRAQRALLAGNLEDAARLSVAAERHLPESGKSTAAAALIRGLSLLATNQSSEAAEAVEALKRAKQSKWFQGPTLDELLLNAEAEAAYYARDFDLYLRKRLAIAAAAPDNKLAVAGIALAYACKYADKGNSSCRDSALVYLKKAESHAGPQDPEFQEYRGRVDHCLDTRETVSREGYRRRFPNGYRARSKQ